MKFDRKASSIFLVATMTFGSLFVVLPAAGQTVKVTPQVLNACTTIGGNYLCGTPQWLSAAQAAYNAYQTALANYTSDNATVSQLKAVENRDLNTLDAAANAVVAANDALKLAANAAARAIAEAEIASADSLYAQAEAVENAVEASLGEAESIASGGYNILQSAASYFAQFIG